jgi:hypothetical protein
MQGNDEKAIISAQVPSELRDAMANLAASHERSLSGEIRTAIALHLRVQDPGSGPGVASTTTSSPPDPEGGAGVGANVTPPSGVAG